MPVLRMDLDLIRQFAAQFDRERQDIHQSWTGLSGAVHRLAWQAPARQAWEAEFDDVARHVFGTLEMAGDLTTRLQASADEWQAAGERLGTTSFGVVTAGGGVGSIGGSLLALPIVAAALSIDLGDLRWPSWLTDWLSRLLPVSRLGAGSDPTADKAPATTAPGTPEPTPSASPSATPTVTPALPDERPPDQPAGVYAVPVMSQRHLVYREGTTAYGCVPTAASMITAYWHDRDATHPLLSAQELLDKNVAQAQFGAHGMTPTQVADDFGQDYVSATLMGQDQKALEQALAAGPVIAIVPLNLKLQNVDTPHAVVVTGIDSAGRVHLNDPWTGKAADYSWEDFDKAWGADFGKDDAGNSYATRSLVTIQPASGAQQEP